MADNNVQIKITAEDLTSAVVTGAVEARFVNSKSPINLLSVTHGPDVVVAEVGLIVAAYGATINADDPGV